MATNAQAFKNYVDDSILAVELSEALVQQPNITYILFDATSGSVDAYKTATNWSAYADRIFAIQ